MRPVLAVLLWLSGMNPPGAESDISVADYGALGDGITDDTTALNNAFAAACRSSGGIYFPDGVYLTRPLNPVSGCDMHVYGKHPSRSTIALNGGGGGSLMSFRGPGRTLRFHDLILDGHRLEAAGLDVENMSAAIIQNASIRSFGIPGYSLGHRQSYDGVYLHTLGAATVRNLVSQYNERDGIETQAVHRLTIDQCNLSYNGRFGAVAEQSVEDDSDGPLNVRITNNVVIGAGGGGIDVETAPLLPPALAYLQGNTVLDTGGDSWGYGWGIVLGVNTSGEIRANSVLGHGHSAGTSGYRSGIVVGGPAGDTTIADNIVADSGEDGIRVSDGNGHRVYVRNNITARNGHDGMELNNAPASVIQDGNLICGNAGNGIALERSPNANIAGNHIGNNKGAPISKTLSQGLILGPNTYGECPNASEKAKGPAPGATRGRGATPLEFVRHEIKHFEP